MLIPTCQKFIGSRRILVRQLIDCYQIAGSYYRATNNIKSRGISSDSSKDVNDERSMLYRHLYSRILVGGAITVADYMKEVLTYPKAGYYMSRDVFGADGDFTTSPEISQLFGEMIAVWSINEWKKISDQSIQLVELGPGRGTLSKDILRVYKKLGISDKVSLHLVEVSPKLSSLQAENLCKHIDDEDEDKNQPCYKKGKTEDDVEVFWYRSVYDIPAAFSVIIAQEFFDAMPIHKFQRMEQGWREILVDIDPAAEGEEKFRYVLSRSQTPGTKVYINEGEKRDHVETSPESAVIVDYMANFLVKNGGFALIADYGHEGDRSDTFRAYRSHKQQDPLISPGTADLTADVDFSLLKRIACQDNRLITFGPVSQRNFLKQLGINARLTTLLKNAPDAKCRDEIMSGYRMITDEEQMGNRFKLLSLFPAVLKEHLNRWPVAGFQTTSVQ